MANDEWNIFDAEIQKAIVRARKISNEYVKPYIKQLALYKRALELACKTLNKVGVRHPYVDYDYYMHQAEKELEEQK